MKLLFKRFTWTKILALVAIVAGGTTASFVSFASGSDVREILGDMPYSASKIARLGSALSIISFRGTNLYD